MNRWESHIQAFEELDLQQSPPHNPILFYGSSSIALWDNLPDYFPDWTCLQRGFGGSLISDALHYAPRMLLPYQPQAIVLYAGGNDLSSGRSPDAVINDLQKLYDFVAKQLPQTPLLYLTLKDKLHANHDFSLDHSVNSKAQALAAQLPYLHVVDVAATLIDPNKQQLNPKLFQADGVHVNHTAYLKWAALIDQTLREVLPHVANRY